MKDKMIMFIIGVLVGAIIATGCFLVLNQSNKNQMGERGEMPQDMQFDNTVEGGRPGRGMQNTTVNGTDAATAENVTTE